MPRAPSLPRITIDARMLGSSGIGTYLEELLPRVIALLEDVRFTLLGRAAALRDVVPASERVCYRHFDAPIYSIREQYGYLRVIPRDTTVLWAPHFNIPLAYRGALVTTVHDVNHLAIRQSSLVRRVYAAAMFGAVRRRSAVVLCDSSFTAGEFTRRVGAPKALRVALLGVSERWTPRADDASATVEPYFLYVGNVKPHKNLARLLAAFAALPDDVPHKLMIVGRREGMRTVDHRVATLAAALGERVVYTGYVTPEELVRLIRDCDALVLPSLSEGFGLPPVEALACGRPVAVSRVAALPEVCGPMAEYFDPLDVSSIADSLTRLARRPPDSPDVARRRRDWALRFDWAECASITAASLADAMAGAR